MCTCSYCGSRLTVIDNHADCAFCGIRLGPTSKYGMYGTNGMRKQRFTEKIIINSETAKLSLTELEKLHVIDLIKVLKEARNQRSQIFNLMRIFNKAGDLKHEQEDEYRNLANETGGDYEYWTRRCWMIENLLIDRIGYYPERINNEFMSSLELRNRKSLAKNMTISKNRKYNKRSSVDL